MPDRATFQFRKKSLQFGRIGGIPPTGYMGTPMAFELEGLDTAPEIIPGLADYFPARWI
jgi:hypothetical protein